MPVAYNSLLRRRSSSRTLCFSSSSSAKRRPRMHPSGGQKDESRRVLSRDCREDEGEQSTPLLQLPPLCAGWCAVWRCHAGGGLNQFRAICADIREVKTTNSKRSAKQEGESSIFGLKK
jgi:hypothetical protein